MVSSGGPEEDSATGVWKSLPEWECCARGSAQWSAPQTAPGPSCRAPNLSRWPDDTILPNHGFATLILMSESCAVKRGSSCLRVLQEQPAHWEGGFNLLCPLSCYTEFSCILKQGYLQQTQRQKQKTQKKSSVSVLLPTAPGQLERSGTIKHDRTLTAN